ncbi:MAG: phosphoribosylformylglycinamidine synthase subunit PurQ [Candidatus Binatia bacterium]
MKWGVVTFPGSCDDRDALHCLEAVLGQQVLSLWHKDHDLQGVEAIILPGGFSYGDYLRCGALARFSPIMQSVVEFARAGGPVMGMCNGFQILCESGLLPGVLIQNNTLSFICEWTHIRVETTRTAFTSACRAGEILRIPLKHGEGCYVADDATLKQLEDNGQIVFRYVNAEGEATEEANPNGALYNIAGVTNAHGNVVGLMPHPEHAVEALLGSEDGRKLFLSALATKTL